MENADFQIAVQSLLNKYDGTTLQLRWQEAISFGSGSTISDYWIRDSDNAVNIVWLNSDGIRDVGMIDYVPRESASLVQESTFTFTPLKRIASVEIRGGENIAWRTGFPASGNKMALVTLMASQGHLYWVAKTENEAQRLSEFVASVLSAYLHV